MRLEKIADVKNGQILTRICDKDLKDGTRIKVITPKSINNGFIYHKDLGENILKEGMDCSKLMYTEKGDIVIIKLGDEIREKDIITYKEENVFITHRIVEINEEAIITKGDNNNTEDEPINKNVVLGKVVFIINNVEIWKKVFTDIKVIIPICITVVLFVLLVSYK